MKKSSTFHLEQDIYDIIDNYKKTYNLTSRNDALTRILIEYRTIHNITEPKTINIKCDESNVNNRSNETAKITNETNETDIIEEVNETFQKSSETIDVKEAKITNETNETDVAKEDSEMSKAIKDVYNHMH